MLCNRNWQPYLGLQLGGKVGVCVALDPADGVVDARRHQVVASPLQRVDLENFMVDARSTASIRRHSASTPDQAGYRCDGNSGVDASMFDAGFAAHALGARAFRQLGIGVCKKKKK